MEEEKIKNKEKFKNTKQRGITLIALVITIIILLILAGITIGLVTGDNGLLAQATRAKEETEKAQEKEENQLNSYKQYITASENGNTLYTDKEGRTAVIPNGFYIVPELDDINEGLVISDKENDINDEGNQFVWVPVPEFREFKRYLFYDNMEITSNYTELSGDGININELAGESKKEAEEMYKSVNENGGFYIGRYEAGREGENAVSKKGIDVYNNIIWGNSMTDENGGAVEKARKFDIQSGHPNVTSTLVYGVQWDAVMRWLSNGTKEEKSWVTNSEGKGNYLDNDETNNPAKTGLIEEYQMKHIYDLAGNVSEWTMESYSTNQKVSRGGNYTRSATGQRS